MFDPRVKTKDGWDAGVKVLPKPWNEAHVMAYAPQVISDDENIDSAGTDVESAMSNDDSIF